MGFQPAFFKSVAIKHNDLLKQLQGAVKRTAVLSH